jgi:hypothetical protein
MLKGRFGEFPFSVKRFHRFLDVGVSRFQGKFVPLPVLLHGKFGSAGAHIQKHSNTE